MKHIQKSERSTAAVSREPNRTQDPSSIPQSLWSQKMNSQQAAASQANNALKTGKQVPFAMLYPVIEPLLDKDKAMRLRIIYNGLKERRISRDVFVKHVRGLVGDHVLKLAATKLQEQVSRSSQTAPNQVASNVQFPAQQQHLNSSAIENMDPSIMKLLEDEDETMHSGADEGDTSVKSHPSDSDTAALSQGSNHNSGQLFPPWQTSSQNENASCQSQQVVNVSQQEQHASINELNQHGSASENQLQQQIDSSKELNCIPVQQKQSQDSFPQQQTEQKNPHVSQSLSIQSSERITAVGQEPNRAQDPSSISQYLRSQKMNIQQAAATSQANNALKNGKQVPFAMLFPVIEPLLDKDKAMRLRTIYNRLKKNEISKYGFVKHVRSLVGDHMLKLAVVKLQEQAPRSSQVAPTQVASHSQVPAKQQHKKMPAVGGKQFSESHSYAQLQAEMEELKKEKADLENRLKVALSEVDGFLAQKSSWDKEKTALGDKVKNWIARAVKAESSEHASKLQTCEAMYKAKVKELQSIHNAELKKLQSEFEEVRPGIVKSMDDAVRSFQDGYSTCADKFAFFEDYYAEL